MERGAFQDSAVLVSAGQLHPQWYESGCVSVCVCMQAHIVAL